MRWNPVILASLVSLAGCGGGGSPPSADQAPAAGESSPLAGSAAGRTVVAEVNGVPVYDDCVATQSRALGIGTRAAVEQCIDFELLAQAAQERGKARDPEVLQVRKAEAVRRFLDSEITGPVPDPEHIDPKLLDSAYQEHKRRIYRPPIRHVAHVAAEVPEDEPTGTEADRAARALAGEIYAALADRRDLTADEFFRRALEIAGDRPLGPTHNGEFAREQFKLYPEYPNIHRAFSDATFAVPEVGAVSEPVRTHVGWHVILVTKEEPAQNASPRDAADTLVTLLRRQRYRDLVKRLTQGVEAEVHEQTLERLQAAEDAMRFGAPGGAPAGSM